MAEIFFGDWIVECFGLDRIHILYRFIIEGSRTSDGIYPLEITTPPVSVSGPSWSIRFEWYEYREGRTDWLPGDVSRTGTTYTIEDSLVVILDPKFSSGQEPIIRLDGLRISLPGGNIRMRCRNVDPQLNPWHPFVNPYNFTLPKRRKRRDPTPPPR
jgi:hypothetical protein